MSIIDKFLIALFLVISVTLAGVSLMITKDLTEQITELEENFRHLEKYITGIEETAERRHSEEYYWTSTDTTDTTFIYNNTIYYSDEKNIRIIEKDGFHFCPFCGEKIDLKLVHSCWIISQ